MSSILVINAAGPETRVALVENGTISEFYLERKKDKGIVGNIYKGKVVRVLPGMQAAFVDIGLEKAAFLYVADVAGGPDFSEEFDIAETPEGEHGEAPEGDVPSEESAAASQVEASHETSPETVSEGVDEETAEDGAETEEAPAEAVDGVEGEPGPVEGEPAPAESAPAAPTKGSLKQRPSEPLAKRRRRENAPRKEAPKPAKGAQIQDLLREGQEVIVQVVKDPIGTKGARVTCHISLPGRHLVFMPTVDHVGISRRVENEKERRRLRELVDGLRPPGTGFIVRTVADGVDKEKLVADIKFLLGLWNEMARKKDKLRAPALLHPDLDLILRSIRDLFSAEVEKLVIDDRAEYERISQFVEQNVPQLKKSIELYDGSEPIFDAYGIEQELQRALQRKVWLKSGGYLIMDQAEALVAVDVNSGRFVGKKNLEETITAINIEAAREVVYQLRLRNIGGIIIIDFIDMEKQQNREKVFKALQEALQKDRAKTNIVKISELGLVEMTRKRVRESVGRLLHEPCPTCDGRGHLKSKVTIAYEIFREVQREATSRREDTITISCHPEVAKLIQNDEREALRTLMMRWNRTLVVKPVGSFRQEQYELSAKWSRREDAPARKEKERPTQQQPAPAPKPAQLEMIPQVVPVPAGALRDEEGEDGLDDEEGDGEAEGTPNANASGAAASPGQPTASGRRRRRRRRGRGGGGAPASGAPAGAPPKPQE
jgi:ribonuclease G